MDALPDDIWLEIMANDPRNYGVVSRLSRRHYKLLISGLERYKTAACARVVQDTETYWILPNGLRHGIYTRYNKSGVVESQMEYVDGKRHGKHTVYWWNGTVSIEEIFVRDAPQGPIISYYESGQKCSEATYMCGVRHGIFKWWRQSGELCHIVKYHHGNIIDLIRHHNDCLEDRSFYVKN